ncbi:MAG: SatD family protein, partial [Solobacterium sp.]|nr:SatD family protein [Solobacterium sp.]
MIYYAIIGDVKDSRTLPNRNDVQEKLKKVLLDINRIYNKDIAADFLITLCDEFQGLMLKSNNIIKIVKHIQRELHPIQIRFGIGIGEISTKINKKAAIGADGPAFYAARNVITMIHELEKKIKIQAPDIQISLYTEK